MLNRALLCLFVPFLQQAAKATSLSPLDSHCYIGKNRKEKLDLSCSSDASFSEVLLDDP